MVSDLAGLPSFPAWPSVVSACDSPMPRRSYLGQPAPYWDLRVPSSDLHVSSGGCHLQLLPIGSGFDAAGSSAD